MLIDGLLPVMMETTLVAHIDVTAVHSQMGDDAVDVPGAKVFAAMGAFVVGFVRVECIDMSAKHRLVDGLVVAGIGIANKSEIENC